MNAVSPEPCRFGFDLTEATDIESLLADKARHLTGEVSSPAAGLLQGFGLPEAGGHALVMDISIRRPMQLQQRVPAGTFLTITGHCEYDVTPDMPVPIDDFSHTLSVATVDQTLEDPVFFPAGARIQMLRFYWRQPHQVWQRTLPVGCDEAFAAVAAYSQARMQSVPPALISSCRMLWQCRQQGLGGDLYRRARLLDILAWLLAEPWQGGRSDRRPETLVTRACSLVLDALDEPWTLSSLARRLGSNECYVKQAFRAALGTGFAGWLRHERMRQAAQLLTDTDWPVIEVAQAVGYTAPGRFAQAFAQVHEHTLSAYRNRHLSAVR